MKLEQSFAVPFPCARVWAFLHDSGAVVRCLPGAELTGAGEDGRLIGRFSVKLGPIAAAFAGTAEIAYDEAAQQGRISGAGSDRASGTRARGSAAFALAEAAGGTRVDISVDYTLAGALAQFNRAGIVEDLAARLTAQFAYNLQVALTAEAPPPDPAPLDAGNLLIKMAWGRLRHWLRHLLGRD